MARKSKKSKFLPSGVSGALKSLWGRIVGGVLMLCGGWALFAVCMYDPYMNGFAVASNFGTQSVMGNIVGALRYAVGVVPAFFVLLALTRWGASVTDIYLVLVKHLKILFVKKSVVRFVLLSLMLCNVVLHI